MTIEDRLTKRELKQLRKEDKMAQQEAVIRQQKQNKLIKYGMVGLVIVLLGWWWQSAQLPIPPNESNKPSDQIVDADWTLGNKDAQVKIVEYSDFQCPACRVYLGVDEQLISLFGDRVGFTYRHFPLREIHKNANIAAQASEAAGKQGKFWEMSRLLFSNQDQWSISSEPLALFTTYATEIGLDVAAFSNDIGTKETRALVEADYVSGLVSNINATPTFIINGQKMNNLKGPEDLLLRVDLILREATASAQN